VYNENKAAGVASHLTKPDGQILGSERRDDMRYGGHLLVLGSVIFMSRASGSGRIRTIGDSCLMGTGCFPVPGVGAGDCGTP
jgi:hypothetical protein